MTALTTDGRQPAYHVVRKECCYKYAITSFGLLSLTLGWAAGATAETTQCTAIANLPATINIPGIYCLTSDFATNIATGPAIYIEASHVVLDLNGHVIDNLAAGPGTTATGVTVSQRKNVTIKNGTLRGFYCGIHISDIAPYSSSQGNVVEDLRVDRSTFNGLRIACRGCVVRRNVVVASGQPRLLGTNRDVYGVLVFGPGNRVIDNDVISVKGYGTGLGYGIGFGLDSENCATVNNRISEAAVGIANFYNSSKYRDNLTLGVLTPYGPDGTDAGNNH